MNSSQLVDLAKSFWQSVARPLAELSAAVVVVVFALGFDQSGWTDASFQGIPLVPRPDTDAARALTLYGLDKIVPAAVALMLLVVAQASSKVVTALGVFLPGGTTLWRMRSRSKEAREKVRVYLFWLHTQTEGSPKALPKGSAYDEKIRVATDSRMWTFCWTRTPAAKELREVGRLARDMFRWPAKPQGAANASGAIQEGSGG